jgi:hypothetical protein
MSSFPSISPLSTGITSKIENTSKVEFGGSKPFITLTNFVNGEASINYTGYTAFNLNDTQQYKERFPAIITGLDVGVSGNLGTIRKAKVQVKFASMSQFEANKNFIKVGITQLVSWGWLNNNTQALPNLTTTAKSIVTNILNWQNLVKKYNHRVDFLAGILTNFTIKMNSDATVDVELELSSPSEIPGFLSLTKTDKGSTLDADSNGDSLSKICKALDLDGTLSGTTEDEIKKNSINYAGFGGIVSARTIGNTNTEYIRLGFALDKICNSKFEVKDDKTTLEIAINLANSVATCHPNMISVSENVVFPNSTTIDFIDGLGSMDRGRRKIKAINTTTQRFGPFNGKYHFPEDNVLWLVTNDGKTNIHRIGGKRGGYIENIYISTDFLIDVSKGANTIYDFLQKVVDELNVAGADLYNLIIKPDFTDKNGKEIFTIVDLNIVHDKIDAPTTITLFTENSSIIDLSVNADLPKEIAGQLILGEKNNNTMGKTAHDMFSTQYNDDILRVADATVLSTNAEKIVKYNPGFWAKAGNFLSALGSLSAALFKTSGPYRVKFANVQSEAWYGSLLPDYYWGIYKDVSAVQSFYEEHDSKHGKNALIPVTISMTVLGISGVTIGTAVKFKPSPVPWLDGGFWQVTNVEHKVDDSKWETIIEFKYRVGK